MGGVKSIKVVHVVTGVTYTVAKLVNSYNLFQLEINATTPGGLTTDYVYQ